MDFDLGSPINEKVLNEIQNSLDYKSKIMLADRFRYHTNQMLQELGAEPLEKGTPRQLEIDLESTQLSQAGYAPWGPTLDKDQAREVYEYFLARPCYNNHVPVISDGVGRSVDDSKNHGLHASYLLPDILRAPYLLETANDQKIIDVATGYLGCFPTLYSINAYWSFPDQPINEATVHSFHRDLDDFKFCSFFIYLTDCLENDGAHQYIRHTHRPDLMQGILPEIDPDNNIDLDNFFSAIIKQGDEAYEHYFKDLLDFVPGRAGDGFFSDPFGVHRACPNITKSRLVIWIRFGLYRNQATKRMGQKPIKWKDVEGRVEDTPLSRYLHRFIIE